MKKFIITIFLLLALAVTAFADTHTVSEDCSASAVQTAINAAAAGDVIDVTCTGTVTWSTGLTLSGGKTLRGGGEKTGAANTTTGTWPLTINVTHTGASALIEVTNAASEPVNRITGFKFQGTGGPSWIIRVQGVGVGSDSKGAFRIDNNYFDSVSYGSRVTYTNGSQGKMTGLFDHNVFYYDYGSTPHYGLSSYDNAYRGASSTCYGYDSLHRAVGFGSDDFVFWEDNYLKDAPIDTPGQGGRLVVRYNSISSSSSGTDHMLDGHGADVGGYHSCGTVANEFYENTLTGTFAQITDMRGGKWRVYNNTMEGGMLQFNEYRLTGTGVLDWKACSGTWCCETPKCDIQAPDADDFAACYPLPNQITDTYLWNNIQNSSNMSPSFAASVVETYIVLNRDYWIASTGLAVNIPGTCTVGAGYWATDTSTLYKCTSTNTWTASYTPYTYPHPLRGESDTTAPTNTQAGNSINADGDELTLNYSESVVKTGDGTVALTCSGGAVTPTYASGSGTANHVYTLGRTINQGEVCTVSYTQGGNDLEDTAGNELATYSDHTIVNGSTQQTETTYDFTITVVGNGTINSSQGGIQCHQGNTPCVKTCDSGTVLTLTTIPDNGWGTGTISGTNCGATTTMSAARTCTVTFPEIHLFN